MKKKSLAPMEGIPEETREEFYNLFEGCLQSAVYLLETNKVLCPFAVTLSKNDEFEIIGNYEKEQSRWAEDTVWDLEKKLFKLRDDLKAAAIIGGKTIGKYDAFSISVEHRECGAIEIIVPFVLHGDPAKVKMKWRAGTSHRVKKYLWKEETTDS